MTEVDCDEMPKKVLKIICLGQSYMRHRTFINTLVNLGQCVTVHHITKFKKCINCTI